ncbi:MAG: photosystem II stability/assembly factor-like uncharacterized protein [Planctomycetota bacterium]|jgi:photosystem II stability/assembly factor-like uncharacterized protein
MQVRNMNRSLSSLVFALLLFLGAACASKTSAKPAPSAEANKRWEALPAINTGTVNALGGDHETLLLAGTGAGLHVSENQGDSWQRRSPADWRILSALRTTPGTVLTGTYRRGVQRSADGGATWEPVGFANNVYVDALLEDSEGRIFAAVAHSVDGEPAGIFRSDDDGKTWAPSGLQDQHTHSLSSPLLGQLYAGAKNGTFRSRDGGATWSRVEALSLGAPLSEVVSLDNTLCASFAEPRHRAPGAGVLCSTDEGATWTTMTGLPAETSVHALAVVGETIFAATGDLHGRGGRGLYRSRDRRSWEPAGLQDHWLVSLMVTPDRILYAGAEGSGAFASRDGGSTWTPTSDGIENWNDAALALDRAGRLFALTLRELYAFDEPSGSWTSHNLPEGTAPPTPWNFLGRDDGTLVLPGRGCVFVSNDAGRSWIQSVIPGSSSEVFALHEAEDGRLFAVLSGQGLFVLERPDQAWARVDAPGDCIGAFVSSAGTLFALGAEGLWRAPVSGEWERVGPPGQRAFAMHSSGDLLFLASPPEGVLESGDDGQTWKPAIEALRQFTQQPGYLAVHSLLGLPNGGLLAATFSNGVLLREPDGAWTNVTDELPTLSAGDISSGPDGHVYLHTTAGVFRYSTPE